MISPKNIQQYLNRSAALKNLRRNIMRAAKNKHTIDYAEILNQNDPLDRVILQCLNKHQLSHAITELPQKE